MQFAELLSLLLHHWRRVTIAVLCGALLGTALSLVLPTYYRVQVVLAPASELSTQMDGSLGSLASRFGGLASLAGVDLGATTVDRASVTIATLRGQAFLVEFAKRRELVVPLFAGKSIDKNTNEWRLRPGVYDSEKKEWTRRSFLRRGGAPSDSEIYRRLKKYVKVDQDRRTGLIQLYVETRSPTASLEWSHLVVRDVNDFLRDRDVAEARRTINYLEEQIKQTPVTEMQSIFYRLIEEQTKRLMLAQVSDEYAVRIVDPSVVPDRPSSPNRLMLVLLCSLSGFALATLSILIPKARGTS